MKDVGQLMRGKVPGPETGIEVKKSICTICDPESQCGLDLYVKEGKIIKVEGSKENPHSEGTLCSKGSAIRQYVYHKDRIKTPLKRVGPRGSGRFEPIAWDEALDEVAGQLNQVKAKYGPESVVFFSGYSFWYRPFLHRMSQIFGSPNFISNTSVCHVSMVMAQMLTFGIPAGPDIRNTACLLVWGTNPFHSLTCCARHLLDAKEKGLKIIAVDPRYSPTAAQADIHLQLKPGTDGALALAMAHVIINEGLYDEHFIREHAFGFDEYREYVQDFFPERGEELTGVPAEKIRAAARLFATTKPAAFMPGSSPVVHNTNGLQNQRAAFTLIALTGNYDIAGGMFAEPLTYLYMSGGFISREAEFKHPRKWEDMAPRIGDDQFPVWSHFCDEAQGMHLPFQIQSEKPYPIKAMMAFGINYRMWPDTDFLTESFEKLAFVAVADIFMTESCRKFADIVLPACTSVERSEFRCWPERYVIYTQPAIKPLYESRPDIDIILELGEQLGLDDPLLSSGFEASLDWILEPGSITVEELKRHPAGMPVPNAMTFPEKKYLKDGFMTPSGKLEFTSSLLEKYAKSDGYAALPVYHPPKYSLEATPEIAQDYPFILNTGSRLPMFIGSQTYRLSWTRSLRPDPCADLNPDDCLHLGIKQGEDIKIATRKGAIVVKANLTNIVQPGVVHMSPAYIDVEVNSLIEADYLDPISGYPGYKALLCRVEKVTDQSN